MFTSLHQSRYGPGVPSFPEPLLLFHDALQRMLVFAGKVHNLCHLGFRDFVGKNPAFANPMVVDVQHYPRRGLMVLVEETLDHMDHEFHRCVVIIEDEHTIQARPLGLRPGLADDGRPGRARIATAFTVITRQPQDAADRTQGSIRRTHFIELIAVWWFHGWRNGLATSTIIISPATTCQGNRARD